MPDHPPPNLLALLAELGLDHGIDQRRLARQARRLARNLPVFDSVWIDALLQARQITRFQAAEIQAGRGPRLRVGPYVLEERLAWPAYAAVYRARRRGTDETVRLLVVAAGPRTDEVAGRIEKLAGRAVAIAGPGISPIIACGVDDSSPTADTVRGPTAAIPRERRVWAASVLTSRELMTISSPSSAAQWMVRNGRFPPHVVLEVARQMAAALATLEKAKLLHGDINAQGLFFSPEGDAVLLEPGLRGIVRPAEGYAYAELPPEAYENLAPERVADGGPPSLAADFYACGCLWWHMLCGRAALTGGDGLSRLQAAHAARIIDARRFAPQAPAELIAALTACLAAEPERRPASTSRLIDILGAPTPAGREALSQCLRQSNDIAARWIRPIENVRVPRRAPRTLVAATCLLALIALAWEAVRRGNSPSHATAVVTEISTPRSGAKHLAGTPPTPFVPQGVPPPARLLRPTRPATVDTVRLTSAVDDLRHGATVAPPEQRLPADVVALSNGRELSTVLARLKPGQTVRGPAQQRPRVVVPAEGLAITVDDLHFENIDFVGPSRREPPRPPTEPAAMLRLSALRCEFHRCSFAGDDTEARPCAVVWTHAAAAAGAAAALDSGQIEFRDCVLRSVDAAVECRTAAALALRWNNTLLAASGPVVRLVRAPTVDEPLSLILSGVTLRRTGPLLACYYTALPPQPGSIQVRASLSVMAPDAHAPLLLFQGPQSPQPLLEQLRWSGQGTLLAGQTPVAAWQREAGQTPQPLDDASFAVEGLVRSDVEFAGVDAADPLTSRVVRWQVPLRSPDPPGADPDLLPGAVSSAVQSTQP